MITCQIQWVDKRGNKTPDTNPAIGIVTCHSTVFGKQGSKPFFICEDHAKCLPPNWRFHKPEQVKDTFQLAPSDNG